MITAGFPTYSPYAKPNAMLQRDAAASPSAGNLAGDESREAPRAAETAPARAEEKPPAEQSQGLPVQSAGLRDIVTRLNSLPSVKQRGVEFEVIENGKRPYIEMRDAEEGRPLRRYAPRELLNLERSLHDLAGFQMNLVA